MRPGKVFSKLLISLKSTVSAISIVLVRADATCFGDINKVVVFEPSSTNGSELGFIR